MVDFLLHDGAAWFSVPAFLGTCIFLIQMTGLFGGADSDLSAGDAGADGHSDSLAGVLSVQSCAAFAMGFGLGGLAVLRGSDWGIGAAIGVGAVAGIGFVVVLMFIFRQAARLNSSGNIGIGVLVGREADVVVGIPTAGAGRGEIRAVIGDRERRAAATSQGAAIAPRARVVVIRVNGDNSVTVRPVGAAEGAA